MKLCTAEWLAERCYEDEDGCLIWNGQLDRHGCPVTWTPIDADRKRYRVMVRRDALAFRLGRPIDPKMRVTVSCGKTRCVKCLEQVTASEVIRRQWERTDLRSRKVASITKASRARWKLDMDKAREIRNSSCTLKEVSQKFGVSMTTASLIRRGLAWKEDRNPFAGLFASNDSRKAA